MANTLIPFDERNLTPDQVERLDRRRRRGQLFVTIGVQCLVVGILTLLWSGQDATYSPGLARPMVYWNLTTFGLSAIFILSGLRMRRGFNEFLSY